MKRLLAFLSIIFAVVMLVACDDATLPDPTPTPTPTPSATVEPTPEPTPSESTPEPTPSEPTAKTYKVTLKFDEETEVILDVEENQKVDFTGVTIPERDAHDFGHWLLGGEPFDVDAKVTKNIELVAKWNANYDKAITLLKAHYQESLSIIGFSVTEDVELIADIDGLAITWSSSNTDYFANDGQVVRPAFSLGDQNILLTAEFTSQKKEVFMIKVSKLEQTVEEKIDEALRIVTIVEVSQTGYQETNFDALAKYTIDGEEVDVIWTTSDATVMTAKGVLVAFEDASEKTVTLTATITYQDVTRTKEIEFLVKGVTTYETLVEALTDENKDEKVKVEGVYFYKTIKHNETNPVGYYIASPDNVIAYVHGAVPAELKPGKLYDVIFTVDIYFGTYQVKTPAFSNERDGELPEIVPVEMTVSDVVNLPKPLTETYNQELILLKNVKVVVEDMNDNYKTFLVDQSLEEGTTLTDKNSIMIYYVSNLDVIRGLDGKKIDEILVINNGYRTNNVVWYVNYIGDGSDIVFGELTAQEKLDSAIEELEALVPYTVVYPDEKKINLPSESQFGVSIEWAVDNPDYFNFDTNELVFDAVFTRVEEVFFTATLTVEDDEGNEFTEEFARWVEFADIENLQTSSIEDLLEYDDLFALKAFKITGIITGLSGNDTYTFYDGTDAIAVYALQGASFDVGYEYTITGRKDIYNGLVQLRQRYEATKGDQEALEDPVVLTEENLKDAAFMLTVQSHLVSIANAEITALSKDSFGNVEITFKVGTATINLRWDSRVSVSVESKDHINELLVGDKVNIVGAPLGWFNAPQLGYNDKSQLELVAPDTDAEAVEIATKSLSLPAIIEDDIVLPTEGRYGTTIVWVSSNTDVLAADGTLTEPTSNVTLKLTATVTLGDASEEREFIIYVQVVEGVVNVRLARELEKDADVVVEGLVTGIGEGRFVYVSDFDGTTIHLFYYPEAMPEDVEVGDFVTVTGVIDVYNGLVQVKEGVIVVESSDNEIPPALEFDKIPEFTADDQGKRYNIDNLYVVSVSGRSMIVTDGEKEVTVYSDMNVEAINTHLTTAVDKKVNLVNIHLGWFNKGQFLIYDESEVVVEELTVSDQAFLKLAAIELPEVVTEDITLDFPDDSSITWLSSHPEIITIAGVVTVPEEATVVTLTAKILPAPSLPPVERDFEITVKPGKAQYTATLKYPGGETDNLDEAPINVAAVLGLNPEIFEVFADKGPAFNNIGINKDGTVRIYSVRQEGVGNKLTVKVAEGNTIIGVKFNFETPGNKSNGGLLILGETEINLNGADLLVAQTYDELEITEFSLTNVHEGGDANGQIWITSIEITYSGELVDDEGPEEPEVEITSIADFLLLEVAEEATIKGVVTNLGPFNSYSFEDDTGAVAFRVGGKNASNIDFEVGDLIVATVKKEIFNGLIQATVSGDYEVVESGKPMPDAIDLTNEEFSAENLLKYQSYLIKIDGAVIVSLSKDGSGNLSIVIKNAADEQLTVRIDNRTDVDFTYFDDFEAGDIVNINGATLGWFNAPQGTLDNVSQFVLVD